MNKTDEITLSYLSENAVLLEWPETICSQQHQQIIYFQQQIQKNLTEVFIDSIASYTSLILYYHFDKISNEQLDNLLREFLKKLPNISLTNQSQVIEIPVYYGPDSGWDLNFVAQQTSLSIEQIIQYHSQTTYHAYALGFTPGFCYLASLPKSLQLPRRSSPRLSIPQGAVAIAEQQTAVYPTSSPAGWHVIGQTPMAMFNVENNEDTTSFLPTINVGQQIRFKAISQQHFFDLGGTVGIEDIKERTI
jgi:KipI family sensor histidine kinase inhibitor